MCVALCEDVVTINNRILGNFAARKMNKFHYDIGFRNQFTNWDYRFRRLGIMMVSSWSYNKFD